MYTVTVKLTKKEMNDFLKFAMELEFMNITKIEWADYTWNPVVGCKHNCSYCYARRMNDRFKWINEWNEIQFFPERINEMLHAKLSIPKNRNRIAQQISPDKPLVFVGSMCDLWGEWVAEEWINTVLEVVRIRRDVNFAFLTKNPSRYLETYTTKHGFLENMYCGATITGAGDCEKVNDLIRVDPTANIFASIEPILTSFPPRWFDELDFVIVGAMTGAGAIKPKREWIDSIQHDRIYYKDNIMEYLEEDRYDA